MTLLPLQTAELQAIQLIATDMDGTLTIAEKFTPDLFQAFQTLNALNIKVVIVTGRSAGWVSAIAHYFPIAGAIAENGGLFYQGEAQFPIVPIPDVTQHRQRLAETFDRLKQHFPNLKESADNRFRVTDWTFDVAGLSDEQIQTLDERCQADGWSFTYSTVQCHIKSIDQSKANGVLNVLQNYFPQYKRDRVLTMGDSPNDESLFDPKLFPNSLGVANLLNYRDRLAHEPTYITSQPEGQGFCELVEALKLRHR